MIDVASYLKEFRVKPWKPNEWYVEDRYINDKHSEWHVQKDYTNRETTSYFAPELVFKTQREAEEWIRNEEITMNRYREEIKWRENNPPYPYPEKKNTNEIKPIENNSKKRSFWG